MDVRYAISSVLAQIPDLSHNRRYAILHGTVFFASGRAALPETGLRLA
jgi:hypothetical protein